MGAEETEIKVKLTAEDGITPVIERIVEELGETKLGHAVTAAGVAFEAIAHALEMVEHAFEAVNHKVEEAIHAAAEHEIAEKKLAAALLITGSYSEENAHSLGEMSDALAKTSGASANAIRDAAALGVSLGIQSNQIESASAAAVDLAAVLNTDVNTAMRQLATTLSGSTGRLGQIIPELKGFTESQLQAGAGITFLNEKLKGYAATLSDTYQGAINKAETSHHLFIASLGHIITHSAIVRESLAAKAAMYDRLTAAVKGAIEWFEHNSETITKLVNGVKVAVAAYGIYFVAINAVTIATTIATAASTAFAAVLAVLTSPITLTVAAVLAAGAAFAYLGVSMDHLIGTVKVIGGFIMTFLTAPLNIAVKAALAVAQAIGSNFAPALQQASDALDAMTIGLARNGAAQFNAAEATRTAAKAHGEHAESVGHGTAKVDEHEQALRRMSAAYARAAENAKPALDAIKEFAPRLSLLDWQRDQKNFADQLAHLKESATIVIKTIKEKGPKNEGDEAMLAKATADIQRASAAQAAMKIKDFELVRESALKQTDIYLEYEKQKSFSVVDEIMLKKIASQEDIRAKRIDILTQELIAEQELQRHYLTVGEEAQRRARETDLNAYKAMLDTQLQLAVDHETDKAIAQDQAAKSVVGLDPVAKAEAQANLTQDIEIAHQQRMSAAVKAGLLDRDTYQRELAASRMTQMKADSEVEIAEHQIRAEMLGLTDEAVKERLATAEIEFQDRMNEIKDDSLLSEEERNLALEDQAQNHLAQMNQIREQNTQNEITRADQQHDYWAVTLGKVRLEQQKHGAIIGAIQGIQHSQQFQAANQLMTNLSSLRNSHSKKAFEVGKAAATAHAIVNTFLSATEAYSALAGIPIVGPILGAVAAAAAVAAGMVNVQQIQSQKFNAAHGGIDEVPMALDNSTFLLKGGERVLQPAANQDMTAAAKKINEGGGAQNITIAITIHGNPSNEQISELKKAVIDGIRDASERGQPIINEKGIVKAS